MHQSQERHYNILKLNKWFAISSVIFTFIWLIAFADDFNRQWKPYQKTFRSIEIEQIRKDLDAADKNLTASEEFSLMSDKLEDAEEALAANKDKLIAIQEGIDTLDAERYRRNQIYQFSKALYDAQKYTVDQAVAGHGDEDAAKAEMNRLKKETQGFKLDLEAVESIIEQEEDAIKEMRSAVNSATDEVGKIRRDKDLLERRLKKTDPEAMSFANKIANIVRDLPVLDFIDPYYEVKQVVVKDLTDDLIYLNVPKVDRCMTCHVGIDKPGFEDAPQPYTTHPDLEKYVAPNSPHPMNKYGCTTCHMGRGRGTDFISTVHYPDSEEQKEEWEDKYHWHKLHHWDQPMLPMKYIEAGCLKCHSGNMPVKGADKLSLGMAIVERGGCFGCHQMDRWEGKTEAGPDLTKIASKTTKNWVTKWINSPRSFREATWMPHFFGNTNNSDEASVRRTNQEIHAITAYLFDKSEDFHLSKKTIKGDPENGRLLVQSLGCLGCHKLESEQLEEPTVTSIMLEQGPALTGLGSKTTASWIYEWIRDPVKYHPDTKMPNLRLTKQEASDIALYLAQDMHKEFDTETFPEVDENELDGIVIDFLGQNRRKSQVDAKLASMTLNEKLHFTGEKLISQYGCYGCHDIGGFEKAKPIGTSLNTEASKLITKLDFGYFHDDIPHTKFDWFYNKINDPRLFDMIPQKDGSMNLRVKKPLDKLRMPHFGLNNEEIEAVVTVIMGLVKDEIAESKRPDMDERQMALEAGEQLLHSNNCLGCHSLDGRGGAVQPEIGNWLDEIAGSSASGDASVVQNFSPPMLDTEGQKVQPEWLLKFLKDPTMIRPQLQVRMPTFNFTDEEINTLIRYFQLKDEQTLVYEDPHSASKSSSSAKAGDVIQDLGACNNCHFYGSTKPKQAAQTWAPNLTLTKERLRPDWVVDWLRDPQAIMPGTKMPAPYLPIDEPIEDVRTTWGKDVAKIHPDSEAMLMALTDYLWSLDGRKDVSSIVKKHLEQEGYGFIEEDEEDEDW
jgi:cbb3-type cytochrome oxidase cytochrome c subunit/cytochrome c2